MEQRKVPSWFDPRNWSFTLRLTLIMILSVLIALIGVTVVTVTTVRTALVDQVSESFLLQAEDLGDLVGAFFQENGTQLQVIATTHIVRDALIAQNETYTGSESEIVDEIKALDKVWIAAADDEPLIVRTISDDEALNPVGHVLSEFLETFPKHTEVFVTDRYGATLAATGRLSDYYQADEEWWQATWNNGKGAVSISDPEFDESAGVAAILIGVPVYGDDDEVIGVLRSTLVVDDLFAIVSRPKIGQTGHAVLFLPSAEPLFDPRAESGKGSAGLPLKLRQHLVTRDRHDMISQDQANVPAVYGHLIIRIDREIDENSLLPKDQLDAAINNLGWAIVVRQDTSEAFAAVDRIVRNVIVVSLVIVGLGGLTALIVARTITGPLVRLSTISEEIGAGNLNASLPPARGDEVGRLTSSIGYMAAQLRNLIDSLEQRVAARTQRLEIVASLSEYLTGILDFDRLLAELVNRVKEAFAYYHAHVYIIDDEHRNLVMAAGAGEAGIQMKAEGHYIPLNAPTSLVARAARTGEIVTIDNVRESEDWLPNPLLPDTYSEMAVPIFLDGQVVGVLDVQEDRVAGLDEADANLLRSLANQVAVAIRNARLFAEVEAALIQAHELQRRYVEQTWDRSQITRHAAGRVKFSLGESTTLDEATIAKARAYALTQAEPTFITLNDQQNNQRTDRDGNESRVGDEPRKADESDTLRQAWVAPIILRDVPIGNLQLHEIDPNRKWTQNELALINAVIDQVTQTAENLRLIDEARERASRERLIGQISDKLRNAPDIETLMKIGVEELSRVLKSTRTFVHFGSKAEMEAIHARMLDKSAEDIPAQSEEDPTILANANVQKIQAPPNGQEDE